MCLCRANLLPDIDSSIVCSVRVHSRLVAWDSRNFYLEQRLTTAGAKFVMLQVACTYLQQLFVVTSLKVITLLCLLTLMLPQWIGVCQRLLHV